MTRHGVEMSLNPLTEFNTRYVTNIYSCSYILARMHKYAYKTSDNKITLHNKYNIEVFQIFFK